MAKCAFLNWKPRVFWVKPSVKYLSSYISKHQIDTIITTGPPHSVHLIGMQLKVKHKLRWYADFRDPWTDISYHKNLNLTQNTQQKHLKLERQVLNKSDQIIVTSSQTKQLFSKITQPPISSGLCFVFFCGVAQKEIITTIIAIFY